MGRHLSTTLYPERLVRRASPGSPVRLAAAHSFISSTSSISFTSIFLRTLLHNGHSSTPLQSILYALFLSRRGCTLPLALPSRPRSLLTTPYPPQVLSFHILAHSFAHFCIFLRSPRTQLPCFQSFPHSLHKTPGGRGCSGVEIEIGKWKVERLEASRSRWEGMGRTYCRPAGTRMASFISVFAFLQESRS